MAEAGAERGAEEMDAGRFHTVCIDLEENIRKAIASFLKARLVRN